jgi:hypothetical protein
MTLTAAAQPLFNGEFNGCGPAGAGASSRRAAGEASDVVVVRLPRPGTMGLVGNQDLVDPAAAGAAFRTAANTSSAEGKDSPFRATTRPSTETVNSPWSPLTTSTWTPGSFFRVAARLAACARIEPQTGH